MKLLLRIRLSLAAAILIVAAAAPADAQRTLPFSDDALVLGFGQMRAGFRGSWEFYDQVYGNDGNAVNYGSRFSYAAAGTGAFPALTQYESAIRTVADQNAFTLSLGATDVHATHRSGTTSLLLDLGLPGRLMVSAEVPFVRVETTTNIAANSAVSSANVGVNPALTSTAAFAADTALANQIARARITLNAQLSACAGSSAPQCTVINERRTEAQTLVATSAALSSGILLLSTAPFVPLASSSAQAAITSRVAAAAAAYRNFGINTVTAASLTPAAAPITGGQYRDLLTSGTLGAGGSLPLYRSLTRLGDINVTAKFRVTDSDKLRAAGFGKIFFPTGGTQSEGELLPLAAGEGTTRAEFGGIADFFVSRRIFITATGSAVVGLSDSSTSGSNLLVAPGYAVNRWMALGVQYRRTNLGDAANNRIGAGVSFSNLSPSRTSGPLFPVEASFLHTQSVSGSGFQPKIFSDEIRIRIFARR